MAKKKRKKQKSIQVKKQKYISPAESNENIDQDTSIWGVKKIFKKNWKFILLIMAITLGVYANSLPGDFSIVDDIPGIITSGRYDNISDSLNTFHVQNIIYSLLLKISGKTPLAFHTFSLTLQVIIVGLVFILVHKIWNLRIAQIASIIFAVHPVNTESVTWISGSPYLINAMFLLPAMICYMQFKQLKKEGYLVMSLIIYSLALLLTRTTWVLTLPIALVLIDQFIIEKKFNWKSLLNIGYYLIPSVIYVFTFLRKAGAARLASRTTGSYLNQQTLSPIFESYPYTIYSMLRLYLFPIDLKIYYDGNIITRNAYIMMVIVSLLFVALVLFVWFKKKNVQLTGILLLLPALLAPSFSPIKVTWNMSERYLYMGTIFFSVLVAWAIVEVSKRVKWKYLWILLTVILAVLFSIRTILRNHDYLDNKEFARITIKSAPRSVRPYNDLGTLYYMDGDMDTALTYYRQSLGINPLSATAINNIGLIFMKNGIPDYIWEKDYFTQLEPDDYEGWLSRSINSLQNDKMTNAAYYIVGAIKKDPTKTEALNILADLFSVNQQWEMAEKYYLQSLEADGSQAKIYFKLSVIEGKQLGNYEKAQEYTEKTLELDPNNQEAKKNLELLKNKAIIFE